MNLLQETISAIPNNAEVLWVGSYDGNLAISWNEFTEIAKDIEYDEDYGSNKIPLDLVVVGKDWWLERSEYDGSEWWSLKKQPVIRDGNKFNNITEDDTSPDTLKSVQHEIQHKGE